MRKIFALLLFFFAIGNAQAVLRAVAGTTGSVINASGGVTAGAAVSYTDTGFLVQGAASSAPYVQFAVQNTSTSSNASADYIAANNVTTSSTNYTDMGINSSTYSEGGGALQGAGNGYFFCQSVDCFFGTGSQNIVHIGTNALPGGLTTDAATVTNNLWTFGGQITGPPAATFVIASGSNQNMQLNSGTNPITTTGPLTVGGVLTGVAGESFVSSGANVFNVTASSAGALVSGAPYMQVGWGNGSSQGIICGTVTSGNSGCWGTYAAPTVNNFTFQQSNSGATYFNTENVGYLSYGGAGTTTAQWNSTTFSVGTQINLINSTGAISAGSYTANSNGIENSAGQIGHLISNSVASAGSAVSTGSPANIGSLASLAPGVYDVWAQCDWNIFAATVTQQQCGISYTSATLLTQAGGTSGGATISNDPYAHSWQATTTTLGDMSLSVGPVRVKITATSTIYQVGSLTFSAGTAKAFGSIRSIQVEHDMFKRLQEQWMDSQLVDAPMVPDKLLFNTDRLHPRPDLM